MAMPERPKIYHIVHVDRLASIVSEGAIWSDAVMLGKPAIGSTIGMSRIKERRLRELTFDCHPSLHVGECAPFYFCSRSIMLFLIYRRNEELAYKGGQEPIVHLEADLFDTIEWAENHGRRWAFTLSNAGAYLFEDRANVDCLEEVNWAAVQANQWSGNGVPGSVKEGKQAEFLVETSFPWRLVERIGIYSAKYVEPVSVAMRASSHRPQIAIKREWYY